MHLQVNLCLLHKNRKKKNASSTHASAGIFSLSLNSNYKAFRFVDATKQQLICFGYATSRHWVHLLCFLDGNLNLANDDKVQVKNCYKVCQRLPLLLYCHTLVLSSLFYMSLATMSHCSEVWYEAWECLPCYTWLLSSWTLPTVSLYKYFCVVTSWCSF